jgi:hypothetical protein
MVRILQVHRSSQRNQHIVVFVTILSRSWFVASENNNDENENIWLFDQNSKLVNSEKMLYKRTATATNRLRVSRSSSSNLQPDSNFGF